MKPEDKAVVRHMVEALEQATPHLPAHTDWHFEAIEAGKALLEQPVQDERYNALLDDYRAVLDTLDEMQPVAWVGLTEEDKEQHRNDWHSNIHDKEFAAIEAKLREKNGGAA